MACHATSPEILNVPPLYKPAVAATAVRKKGTRKAEDAKKNFFEKLNH